MWKLISDTPWKFNIAPKNIPSQKERIVFQPAFFRGELLNFGSVVITLPETNIAMENPPF